ncbi:hypothetical protein [Thiocapsa imhoffii]|uniref:hypothetical protein n=1 Tax=Thiocapsa imhoffii TaxID=382777 RepID=UPI001F5BD315|nr:hypothetical protein [Thiocapsa imhoffii]
MGDDEGTVDAGRGEQRGEVGVLGVGGCGDDERREQEKKPWHREIRVRVSNGATVFPFRNTLTGQLEGQKLRLSRISGECETNLKTII